MKLSAFSSICRIQSLMRVQRTFIHFVSFSNPSLHWKGDSKMILIKKLTCLTIVLPFFLMLPAVAGPFDPDKMIDKEKVKPKGIWEEVTLPDTLDLAARAEIALNVLTGDLDSDPYMTGWAAFNFSKNPPEP